MRCKRALNNEQIKYLIKNSHKSNGQLAEELGIKPNLVGVYKSRARKAGIDVPKQSTGIRYKKINTVSIMKDLAKEIEAEQIKETLPHS